ncbi:Transmembrane protein 222 [Coccomyxa sp. Obi]|nr:Transmembrane protein 222 [Coccomyxa sp. Obi]
MCEEPLPIVPPKQFPYCIVWVPIPVITWLLPFVGHMGICTSKGVTLDFAGPYFISVDNLAFGTPTRYVRLDPAKASASSSAPLDPRVQLALARSAQDGQWDAALQAATQLYQQRMYNFLTDNCHCFVAQFLNDVTYDGSKSWNTVRLATMVCLRGKHVSWWGAVKTWLPFCIIMGVGLAFGTWYFALAWACGLLLPLLLWFAYISYAGQKKPQSPQPM